MKPSETIIDYPCWEDLPIDCPPDIEDNYYELFKNQNGFKFGGWATLIQSEIQWNPKGKNTSNSEFIFQIDSNHKVNWFWGDGGVGYFGLNEDNKWHLSWQCY